MSAPCLTFQTLYAELLERCSIESFQRDFPPGGNFYAQEVKGRKYWYYQKREPGLPGLPKRYVGPDSETVRELIGRCVEESKAYKERRRLVQALKSAGFAGPDSLAGRVLERLAEDDPYALKDAWEELQGRGPKWRELARQGASLLAEETRQALERRVGVALR